MVIDDDTALAESARELLSKLGHEVNCYPSVLEALAALALLQSDERPELGIVDFHMPTGSGLNLLREGKELMNNIPTVLFTGHIHPHDERAARELGFLDIFIKPIPMPEFISLLEQRFFSLAHR